MQNVAPIGNHTYSLAVREPVRMDLTYHGARFIIGEFIIMTMITSAFAGLELLAYLRNGETTVNLLWAGLFACCAANALTFLLLARTLARNTSLPPQTAYTGKWIFIYTIEAVMLLLMPGVFPVLALMQRSGE